MLFVDKSNKIKYSFYTVFIKKSFCNIFAFYLFFNRVFLVLLNQIFILNIHDCSERNHLRIQVFSIVLVYQKVIIRFFKLYFSFCSLSQGQEILNNFIEYLHSSFALRVIWYSIDSYNSFRFTIFLRTLFIELSSFISLISIRNIICDYEFFRLLRWSQLCYNLMELPIHSL